MTHWLPGRLQYLRTIAEDRPFTLLFGVCALITAFYFPAIGGPLVMDDYAALAPLFDQYQTTPWHELMWSQTGPAGRPISMLSFLANIWLMGTGVAQMKLVNIVLHLLNAIVAYFCVRAIFANASGAGVKQASLHSLLVVTGWCLNPMHVSTTLYTVQRMSELAMLFSLGSLLAVAHAVSNTQRRRLTWLSISCFCFILGILSKENAVLALPIVWAYLRIVVVPTGGEFSKRLSNWLGVATLILILTLAGHYFYQANLPHWSETFAARGFTGPERMLTESRVIVGYAESFFLPSLKRLPFHYDWLPISRSPWAPTSTALCLATVITAALWCVFGARRNALPRFGMAWFLIGHSLEAGPWPLMLAFEHRNYFPSVGLMIFSVGLFNSLTSVKGIRLPVYFAWMSLSLFVLNLHIITWHSSFNFAYHSYQAHSDSAMARSNLAEALASMGSIQGAVAMLDVDDSATSQLQALCHLCAGGMPVQSRAERLFKSSVTAVDANQLAGLRELTRQIIYGKCPISPLEFASWMEHSILQVPFVHSHSRHDVSIYIAQLFHFGGDIDRAVRAALLPARNAGVSTERLLLAVDYVVDRDCLRASQLLDQAEKQGGAERSLDIRALDKRREALVLAGCSP